MSKRKTQTRARYRMRRSKEGPVVERTWSGAPKVKVAHDPVNHPSHYTDGDIGHVEYAEDRGWAPGYPAGAATKYMHRAGKKQGADAIQDLRKAAWYITRLADWMEKGKDIWKIRRK